MPCSVINAGSNNDNSKNSLTRDNRTGIDGTFGSSAKVVIDRMGRPLVSGMGLEERVETTYLSRGLSNRSMLSLNIFWLRRLFVGRA